MSEGTEHDGTTTRRRIVVGNDGSPGAQTALGWAVAQAERDDADLDVVVAWDFVAKWANSYDAAWPGDADHLAADATTVGDTAVAAVLGGRARPDWLHVRAVQGPPALVLTQASRGADLLVVGSRGTGGFAKLLLGSVSSACVRHATCPTVVVPAAASGNP